MFDAEVRVRVDAGAPSGGEVVDQIAPVGRATALGAVVGDVEEWVRRGAVAPSLREIVRQRIGFGLALLRVPGGIEESVRRAVLAPAKRQIVPERFGAGVADVGVEADVARGVE